MTLKPILEDALARLGLSEARVLVACSAGIDSTVLLDALHGLAPSRGLELVVAHVNHGLRGSESAADEAFVRELAGERRLPVVVRAVRPATLRAHRSKRERPTLQEAARSLRRQAFCEMAAESGAGVVATAHNLDDQVETVLMRLFRGSGPDALGGMAERSRDGWLVRPLLCASREQIGQWASKRGLGWREDSSNASDRYTRNRLRRHWLPALAREFNPQLLRAIANLAEAQRRDSEWIEACVTEEAGRRLSVAEGAVALRAEGWSELPEALARRLVRRALIELGAGRDVRRVHIERMLAFLCSPGPRNGRPPSPAIELPGGLRLCRERSRFVLRRHRVGN